MDGTNPKNMGRIVEDGWEKASVMNPAGAQFKLGKSSVWVWKSCTGSNARPKIVTGFAKEFNMGSDEAHNAVETIIGKLEEIGLLK
jgi:hypothetical protein